MSLQMFLPTPCRYTTDVTRRSAAPLVPPGVPSAATVVIVMCIAALVVVVVLGIYRIHLTHQQEVKLADTTKEEDVTWGDSALTITVNPMEVRGWARDYGGGITEDKKERTPAVG